jgi:plasmid stabilization system protein ParE
MNASISFSARASRETLAAGGLWRLEHPNKADAFADELGATLERLAEYPQLGRRVYATKRNNIRRILLVYTGFHVYYQFLGGNEVLVLSVWKANRRSPKL